MSGVSSWDVIVVGGGPNGLAAAARLARGGRRVCVVERRDRLGGTAAAHELLPGYRVPGLLHDTSGLRPAVVDELDLTAHGLEFVEREPDVAVPRADGEPLALPLLPGADGDAMVAALLGVSAEDAARWPEFVAQLERWRPFVARVLDRPPSDPGDLTSPGALFELAATGWSLRRLGARDMSELLRTAPMCVADWLDEWFETPALKAGLSALACAGTWMGPWSAGTAGLLLLQRAGGGRSVRGGPAAVVEALASAARAAGAETRVNAEVTAIRAGPGADGGLCVAGVTLAGGEELDAPAVLATCDPRRAVLGLLAREHRPPRLGQHLSTWRCRGTTAALHLALEPPKPADAGGAAGDGGTSVTPATPTSPLGGAGGRPVERALLVEQLDDVERAFDAVKYGRVSEVPVLDVWVPSVSDPSLAPPGGHVVSVLIHFAPHALRGGWNAEAREALTGSALAVLRRHVDGLDARLVATELLAPPDLEARYALTGGHPHHGEMALDQLLHMRPSPLCARYATPLPGLYLGGSGSHPGGGRPGAAGRLAAGVILKG